MALPVIKATLFSFSSSYGTGGYPSWASLPSSQLLHHNFEVVLRKQRPGEYRVTAEEKDLASSEL